MPIIQCVRAINFLESNSPPRTSLQPVAKEKPAGIHIYRSRFFSPEKTRERAREGKRRSAGGRISPLKGAQRWAAAVREKCETQRCTGTARCCVVQQQRAIKTDGAEGWALSFPLFLSSRFRVVGTGCFDRDRIAWAKADLFDSPCFFAVVPPLVTSRGGGGGGKKLGIGLEGLLLLCAVLFVCVSAEPRGYLSF